MNYIKKKKGNICFSRQPLGAPDTEAHYFHSSSTGTKFLWFLYPNSYGSYTHENLLTDLIDVTVPAKFFICLSYMQWFVILIAVAVVVVKASYSVVKRW